MYVEKRKRKSPPRPLRFLALASGLGLAVGLFFMTPNFTGNAIGGASTISTNLLGIGMIVLGILGFWFFSKLMNSYV